MEDLALIAERISHSLRSPLSVVQGLLTDLGAGYTLSQKDVSDGQDAANRVLRQLNLLRFFNLETEPELREITVDSFVKALRSLLAQPAFSQLRVRFDVKLPTDTIIPADERYLCHALACILLFQQHLALRQKLDDPTWVIEMTNSIDNRGGSRGSSSSGGARLEAVMFRVTALPGSESSVNESSTTSRECSLAELARGDQSLEALLLIFAEHVCSWHLFHLGTNSTRNPRVILPDKGLPEFRIYISVSE